MAREGRRVKGKRLLAALAASGATVVSPVLAQDGTEAASGSFVEALLAGPLELTRTLKHVLPDGNVIAVSRTYRLRVHAAGEGWVIEGELVDVAIDAPPQLAAFAEIERKRDDSGLFPMRLSREGSLLPYDSPHPTDRQALGAARAIAVQRIDDAPFDDEDAGRADAMLQGLSTQVAGKRTGWPLDLFRPNAASRAETRELSGGSILVELEAETDGRSGLMRRYERRVTTRVGTSERVVREVWTLRPVQGE